MVIKGHPRFSVFRHDGRHVLVPDRALVPLRAEERRQRPKAMAKRYAQGEQVKLTEGAFEGLTGTVDRSQGSRTWVRFPSYARAMRLTLRTCPNASNVSTKEQGWPNIAPRPSP